MSIADKIEEIRKKPEHVRLRYVWFFVVLSMLFVVALWIFSLKAAVQDQQEPSPENNLFGPGTINQFNEQQKSLDNSSQQTENPLSKRTPPNPLGTGTQNNPIVNDTNNANQQ
jgi:hypothetical protein